MSSTTERCNVREDSLRVPSEDGGQPLPDMLEATPGQGAQRPGRGYTNFAFQGDSPTSPTTPSPLGDRHRRENSITSNSSLKSSKQQLGKRRLSQFLPTYAPQKFTEQEKKTMASFSSVNYSPTDSTLYQSWVKDHPTRMGWDRWLMMVIIGVTVGLTAVLMRQCLTALDRVKWSRATEHVQDNLVAGWGWTTGISCLFVFISSVLVAFVHPPAGGTGVPEVISFLNGIVVHGSLGLKNFVIKFVANVFAVSSGLPCAIQGPVIALGAVIGAGVGQFRSKTLNFNPKMFSRFRNAEDRRNFTSAGVAAGVAAAFNAPIGGLMFAMEDISSFWSRKLSWHTFLCCGIAAATANFLNNAFTGFQYNFNVGLFSKQTVEQVRLHVAIFIPCIALGFIGGILGAVYTRLNVAIQKLRKKIVSKIPGDKPKRCVKVAETLFLVIMMSSFAIFVPQGLGCTRCEDQFGNYSYPENCSDPGIDIRLQPFNCRADNRSGQFSEAATLLFGSGQSMLGKLATRNTHFWYGYRTLLSIFPVWFFLTAWVAGSAIAGGIFIPTLVSGALYGRIIGLVCLDVYKSATGLTLPENEYWLWIDPGVMAMIGAGTLLGGITRLTLAVTIIIVEMSQDISMILPVMVAIFVAKLVADLLSKPLYKYLLEMKSLPYLEAEPIVIIKSEEVNLDLYKAKHVMKSPVLTIHSVETVAMLARMLRDTQHGGFPVVKYDEETRSELCYGLITRNELLVIMMCNEIYEASSGTSDDPICPQVPYEKISVDYIADQSAIMERVKMYCKFDQYNKIYVNIEAFINQSAPKIDQDFSLHRTYLSFRTMGLRHLMVTDSRNRCVGIITRFDLMAFHIAEKLELKAKEDEEEAMDYSERSDKDTVLPAITLPPVREEDHHHDDVINEKPKSPTNKNLSWLQNGFLPQKLSSPRSSVTKL